MSKKPQNPPKKHHYVPEFYLKQFTNPDGCLEIYDKDSQKRIGDGKATPKDVARINNFHRDERRIDPMEIEKRLANKSETELSRTYRTVLTMIRFGCLPNHSVKMDLAYLVALQVWRTPKQRENMTNLLIRFGFEPSKAPKIAQQEHISELDSDNWKIIPKMAMTISQLNMGFMHTSIECPFWTSDHPVAIAVHNPKTGKIQLYDNGGISRKGVEIYLPLSSDILLVFYDNHVRWDSRSIIELKDSLVENYNRMTLKNSLKQIYSSRPVTLSKVDSEILPAELRSVSTSIS